MVQILHSVYHRFWHMAQFYGSFGPQGVPSQAVQGNIRPACLFWDACLRVFLCALLTGLCLYSGGVCSIDPCFVFAEADDRGEARASEAACQSLKDYMTLNRMYGPYTLLGLKQDMVYWYTAPIVFFVWSSQLSYPSVNEVKLILQCSPHAAAQERCRKTWQLHIEPFTWVM